MNNNNLVVRITSDTTLIQNIFSKLKEPQYQIPKEYAALIKQFGGISSSEKGVLISKVTTPEDYQMQMKLLSGVQHYMDRIHDITTDLYVLHSRWMELHNQASRVILMTYFDEINLLKEGVRKSVMAVALQPVQGGLDKIQSLIDRGESTYKHLSATNWNVKEGVGIIKEYLSLLKYGTSVPDTTV